MSESKEHGKEVVGEKVYFAYAALIQKFQSRFCDLLDLLSCGFWFVS